MNGVITDIQKFSLHDGDGIRTTIFLKGCNMRCGWCHNPETIGRDPQYVFYEEKCIRCGHCDNCPTGARVLIGRHMGVEEVFKEIVADEPYYQSSGGGVTLSGGEPLMQSDFAAALLQRCHEAGIRTAVETNLSLPYERIEKMLPWLDHVFFDIKLWNDEAHFTATGVSNVIVLENARRLAQTGIPAVVRTPLVPGLTATQANIGAIATFVLTLPNVTAYELLNFNPLGEGKYRALGRKSAYGDKRPLKRDELEALANVAASLGVHVVYGKE